jgi:predicted aspartyl protease
MQLSLTEMYLLAVIVALLVMLVIVNNKYQRADQAAQTFARAVKALGDGEASLTKNSDGHYVVTHNEE